MTDVRFERMQSPLRTYLMFVDDRPVATVSQGRGGQWTASTIGRPAVSVPACVTRHEAATALLGRLEELRVGDG